MKGPEHFSTSNLGRKNSPFMRMNLSKLVMESSLRLKIGKMDDFFTKWMNKQTIAKEKTSSKSSVMEGYILGSYDFDSLAGHPGIRY